MRRNLGVAGDGGGEPGGSLVSSEESMQRILLLRGRRLSKCWLGAWALCSSR